ncbi:hypothetical protein [Cysteiniphilum sp. QT6929]|uniref:hypothetical protein n=1 Tax=Cysteiniphilum sp. QT6929 TaxID=2975055 RepID=UPI0024B37CC3|nr:hypothetical protein [Cysteiniphilum sp. QT6929]WHN64968.1 hypothetical protein NYP54_07900 [Cysteiniphilum sp. QT6929]
MSLPSLGAVAKAGLCSMTELYGARDALVFNCSQSLLQNSLDGTKNFLHDKLCLIHHEQYALIGDINTQRRLSDMSLKLPLSSDGAQYNPQLENVDVLFVRTYNKDILNFCFSEVIGQQQAQYIRSYGEREQLPRFYGYDEYCKKLFCFEEVINRLNSNKSTAKKLDMIKEMYQAFWQQTCLSRSNLIFSYVKQINEKGFKVVWEPAKK